MSGSSPSRHVRQGHGMTSRRRIPDAGWNNSHRHRLRGGRYEPVSRSSLFERDQGRCHLCGRPVDPTNWHADHVVPVELGGDHTLANLAVAHPECNASKGAGENLGCMSGPYRNNTSVATFQLSTTSLRILAAVARKWGITQTAVIEIALRQMAGEPPMVEVPRAEPEPDPDE